MSEGNQGATPQPQVHKEQTPATPELAPQKKKPQDEPLKPVIIRPLPKVVFLYPSCICAFACGLWQLALGAPKVSDGVMMINPWPGLIFMIVLCINLLILSFEFGRASTLSVLLGGTAVIFLALWLGTEIEWDFLKAVAKLITGINIYANAAFYFCYTGFLLFIFGCIYLKTRFDYWVVTSNELLHYHGFMGDSERFPAPNLRFNKEIEDVFEFLLLQSGRLILHPASEIKTIVLDNVPGINKIERNLQNLLSHIVVRTQ